MRFDASQTRDAMPTYGADAGIAGGQNKLVPALTFTISNVSDQKLPVLQVNANPTLNVTLQLGELALGKNALVAFTVATHSWLPFIPDHLSFVPGLLWVGFIAWLIATFVEPYLKGAFTTGAKWIRNRSAAPHSAIDTPRP